MTDLSINLNKIGLIRNSREGNYPDVLEHAKICIENGCLLYTSPSPRDGLLSRMPSSA